MTPDTAAIREIAALVRDARRITALTGAGISTASGIPDFRSAAGLYSDPANADVFDIDAFRRDPSDFYRFARSFYPVVQVAEPNAAHRALADWERDGREIRVATQNIDDLHERAGSRRVFHVHGTIRISHCQRCHTHAETASLRDAVGGGAIPRCSCGGVFKPAITFFGEMLPETDWTLSRDAMAAADLVLVLGTSLAVYPAASLPDYRRRGTPLVILNREPTPLDHEAQGVARGDLPTLMRAISDAL